MNSEQSRKSVRYYQQIKDDDCYYITPLEFKKLFPYEVLGSGNKLYAQNEILHDMLEAITDAKIIYSDEKTYLLLMDFDRFATAKDDEHGSLALIRLYPRRSTRPTIEDVYNETEYMLNHWRKYGIIPKSRKG